MSLDPVILARLNAIRDSIGVTAPVQVTNHKGLYSHFAAYDEGDFVQYDGVTYRAKTALTAATHSLNDDSHLQYVQSWTFDSDVAGADPPAVSLTGVKEGDLLMLVWLGEDSSPPNINGWNVVSNVLGYVASTISGYWYMHTRVVTAGDAVAGSVNLPLISTGSSSMHTHHVRQYRGVAESLHNLATPSDHFTQMDSSATTDSVSLTATATAYAATKRALYTQMMQVDFWLLNYPTGGITTSFGASEPVGVVPQNVVKNAEPADENHIVSYDKVVPEGRTTWLGQTVTASASMDHNLVRLPLYGNAEPNYRPDPADWVAASRFEAAPVADPAFTNYKGTYDPTLGYDFLDLVEYRGEVYTAIKDAAANDHELTDNSPHPAYWQPSGSTSRLLGRTPPLVETFDVSGTWVKPVAATRVRVDMWAGGGGGTGSHPTTATYSAGGGGGAYAMLEIPAGLLGASESVVVGAGGAGGAATSSNTAGSGGNSVFGNPARVTAYGGKGGSASGTSTSAAGGAGGGIGNLWVPVEWQGGTGSAHLTPATDSYKGAVGGLGYNGPLPVSHGSGASVAVPGPTSAYSVVQPANAPGGGGQGILSGENTGSIGGAGAPGRVIITTFFD